MIIDKETRELVKELWKQGLSTSRDVSKGDLSKLLVTITKNDKELKDWFEAWYQDAATKEREKLNAKS